MPVKVRYFHNDDSTSSLSTLTAIKRNVSGSINNCNIQHCTHIKNYRFQPLMSTENQWNRRENSAYSSAFYCHQPMDKRYNVHGACTYGSGFATSDGIASISSLDSSSFNSLSLKQSTLNARSNDLSDGRQYRSEKSHIKPYSFGVCQHIAQNKQHFMENNRIIIAPRIISYGNPSKNVSKIPLARTQSAVQISQGIALSSFSDDNLNNNTVTTQILATQQPVKKYLDNLNIKSHRSTFGSANSLEPLDIHVRVSSAKELNKESSLPCCSNTPYSSSFERKA
ncbi:unnamed protein product [Thelazia callipaeda]|uniref:Uncharacterized protein n=1 Tax=Thelazia callipaeda TaxID=103827 RepID=A0A0N5D1N2_THECL|nr:unnamed protein product [Thelazia callipaeda]